MKSLTTLCKESVILGTMSRIADIIVEKVELSAIGTFFTSYDELNRRCNDNLLSTKRFAKNTAHKKSFFCRLQLRSMSAFENSIILKAISKQIQLLLECSVRQYGIFLLSLGMASIAVMLGQMAFDNSYSLPGENLVFAVGCVLCSMTLLFSSKSLKRSLREGIISSTVLFGICGIMKATLDGDEVFDGHTGISVTAGILIGLSTVFVSPILLLIASAGIIVFYGMLCIPQIGVMLLFFIAPFIGYLPSPSILSAILVLVVCFCTMIKILRSKRSVNFEVSDGAVAVFFILELCGGFFSLIPSLSVVYAVLYSALMLSYFLVVILITSIDWIKRCIYALLTSFTMVSLYGIVQNYLGIADTTWQDTEMFGTTSGRITSTFDNPNVLAEYLIMCLPFALALFFIKKGWQGKFFSIAVFGFGCAALIFTMSRGAWLGIMIGLFLFMLIYTRKTIIACCFGVLCVPLLPFVLPDSIIKRFTSIGNVADSSTAYRVHIWEGCINLLKDYFAGGIGVGSEIFGKIYPSYTLAGIESAPHAHNLYLQIAIELGIGGLLAFVAIVIILAMKSFTLYSKKKQLTPTGKEIALYQIASLCGFIAVLAQGMTDYIWYNYRVFLMFWLIAGLICALCKAARKEDIQLTVIGGKCDE